uniref:Uncharacterized protein n=1 Tax=Arundo donax TaxID=35708 RepID=A0A0A9BPR7_ARUDO
MCPISFFPLWQEIVSSILELLLLGLTAILKE